MRGGDDLWFEGCLHSGGLLTDYVVCLYHWDRHRLENNSHAIDASESGPTLMRVQLNGGAPRDGRRTVQRERLNLKWFLRSFRLLKEYYHNVLNKIVVQAAAGRAGVCVQMYLGSEAHPAASIPFFLYRQSTSKLSLFGS